MKEDYGSAIASMYDNEVAIDYSQAIFEEMAFASIKFPKFASEHEGYAILLEEVNELWEAVKLNQKNPERKKLIEKECIQVGAMALRFLHDMRMRRGAP
jgi:NTP pyrophosphatase (non-canonical NTP hydrolase)